MSLPDQRRSKRKRISKPSDSPLRWFSVRSLLLCFSFLTFLFLVSIKIPLTPSGFHPVLVVSTLSLLSSSSSAGKVESALDFGGFLVVENRVLFPDHVLLLLRSIDHGDSVVGDLECVYHHETQSIDEDDSIISIEKPLSIDEYDELRTIVRCPSSPANYSDHVDLRWRGQKNGFSSDYSRNGSISSWENVVYSATLDETSAVVFVKGLNLKSDRLSDPSPLTCHFEDEQQQELHITKALAAAQEVVRCPLPPALATSVVEGTRVAIGVSQGRRGYSRITVLPSLAKISTLRGRRRRKTAKKHDLCVCTMVWNQGPAIREWIMYHAWLGVQRWFIYDNNSDDGTNAVIRKLDLENFNVSRHAWPWIKTQEAGFSHCALRARHECRWVSFMDVDEFFYFPYSSHGHERFRNSGSVGPGSLRTLVEGVSSTSAAIAEIRTSCHSYGPSGLSSPPAKGVTVGYMCRLVSPERHKSIVRVDALDRTLLNVVHHFRLRKGFRYLNLPQNTAVINHYKYQVWQVFKSKFRRRVATYVADWHENQNEGSRDRAPGLGTEAIEPPNWPRKFCEVWDSGLRDFVLANLADVSTGLLPWE
ncbi:hypothetical protein M569_03700, partial [Genlisea aurea]